uniref:Uncharacterized protein n=1 Tax=Rhizophora mucronata TaxID=61149 RepID=A0A2P2Q9S7_RHIMU
MCSHHFLSLFLVIVVEYTFCCWHVRIVLPFEFVSVLFTCTQAVLFLFDLP